LEWPDGFGLPGQAGAGSCYNANSHYRLSVLAIAETEVGKARFSASKYCHTYQCNRLQKAFRKSAMDWPECHAKRRIVV
jgi:hypothetical protein